jgi:hypothetical protein
MAKAVELSDSIKSGTLERSGAGPEPPPSVAVFLLAKER